MKKTMSRLISISLLIASLLAQAPHRVYAAQAMNATVTPSTIVNNVANVITVTGQGFDNTAVVMMDGGHSQRIF
jgi:hypothetical protein